MTFPDTPPEPAPQENLQWYAIVALNNELISTGTSYTDPLPDGYEAIKLDHQPDFLKEMWDSSTRSFVPRPDEGDTWMDNT